MTRPDRDAISPRALARLTYVGVALVLAVGTTYPIVAEWIGPFGIEQRMNRVLRSAGWAAGPAAALLLCVRWAGHRRLAAWAALVGTLLVLALGVALYAAALRPDARPSAPLVALTFVPLRQLAAAAVVAWAVWLARRTR